MCPKVELGSDTIVGEVLCSNKDSDEDLVDDAVDLCPDQPETHNGLEDLDGCADPDTDRDHVPDYDDACPQQAGPAPEGCPVKDSDADGIADHLDACPFKAEDVDGDADADGCPEGRAQVQAHAETDQLLARGSVVVRRGRARLTRAGRAALATLIDAIYENPGEVTRVKLVVVPGVAERRRAKHLAKKRGRVVAKAFENAGVSSERVVVEARAADGQREGRVDVQVYISLAAARAREARKRQLDHPIQGADAPAEPGEITDAGIPSGASGPDAGS